MAGFEVSGVSGFDAGIDAIQDAVRAATQVGVSRGAALIQNMARLSMNGPGPNVRTGTLRRSIEVLEVAELGADTWQARIAPTVIYGRIQELGGTIHPVRANMLSWVDTDGNRHFAQQVTLRPRPYMKPGLDKSTPLLVDVFRAAWGEALEA